MASNASAEDGLLAQTAATEPPRKVTKLVVEAPKAEHEEFDLATSVVCLPCSSSGHANALATGSVFVVDNAELAERARNAVLFATSAKQQGDIQAWEEQPAQPCEHTLCLEQVQGTPVGKSMVVTGE